LGWEFEFLEDVSDLEITQPEVRSLMTDVFNAGITGMVAVGLMSMCVRGVYDIVGSKKLAEQEEEVLELVEEIW